MKIFATPRNFDLIHDMELCIISQNKPSPYNEKQMEFHVGEIPLFNPPAKKFRKNEMRTFGNISPNFSPRNFAGQTTLP